jgi:CheY-like chemotaxis protein
MEESAKTSGNSLTKWHGAGSRIPHVARHSRSGILHALARAGRWLLADANTFKTMESKYIDIRSFTVLLVEDDLNDIFLVKRAFKLARVKNPLQVVTDGQEAILYLKGEGKYADREMYPLPKLLVMDIKMPRRSGFEVLEWAKGHSGSIKRIPIVIVSSSEDPADINRAYELGANAYMVKPVDFRAVEHLFQSITQYWGLECAKPELEMA